jgi:hypothetical protein
LNRIGPRDLFEKRETEEKENESSGRMENKKVALGQFGNFFFEINLDPL